MTIKLVVLALLGTLCLPSQSIPQDSTFLEKLFDEEITVAEVPSPIATDEESSSVRLPRSLIPVHYLVRLQPFINGNLTLNGYVEITLDVKEKTNKIMLHINDIITRNDTAKVYLMDTPDTTIVITKQEYEPKRQFYTATLEEDLEVGKTYIFSLSYEGFLNSDMNGFYRSTYKDDDGNTRLLATTQFEPTDARKAFPCFDEPDFKAKFTLEIAREGNMSSISNMPLANSTPIVGQDGWFCDHFNTSLPMAPYLLACIVSDFGYLEAPTTGNYSFRVYARKNAISSGQYAVELGPKISMFYERFFNVPFPLPKQYMAAVPDFSARAMENWGLITFRESSFLYDPEVAKAEDKFAIASIMAHELAHMWFGDLVTPAWWTDLWLNEGFASYMEYIALREVEPTMHSLDVFLVNEFYVAMSLDSLETSHPIRVVVQNPDEINSIFDGISYSKGASILRMMSNYLTEETFRHGLEKYLTELSYSNAEQDDLWRYLTDQAHEDGTLDTEVTVKMIMDTWTLQMGYPVVTVTKNPDGTATLSQERFLRSKSPETKTDDHDYKWWIPITFTSQTDADFNQTTPSVWMEPSEATKVIQGLPTEAEWVIFNLGQTSFYRVNYDTENWAAISAQLEEDPSVFPDANRAQIIDDSLNLARAGKLPYGTALSLLAYLKNEKSFVPIQAAFDNFKYMEGMLSFTGGYGLFKNYLLSLVVPLYEEVNFKDSLTDPHLEQRKRASVLAMACQLGHSPCVDAAVELYGQWMENPENKNLISNNLKLTVYCTAIREGGPKEWKFAWDMYINSTIGTEQRELLQAMGCSKDVWILEEYLDRTLSLDQGIKKQMLRYIIPAIAQSSIGKLVTWQFLRNRWGELLDYLGSVSFVLDEIVAAVTYSLNTDVQLNEMMSFKENYSGNFASAARPIEQATENLKNNIMWMENYYKVIIQWLKSNGYESDV